MGGFLKVEDEEGERTRNYWNKSWNGVVLFRTAKLMRAPDSSAQPTEAPCPQPADRMMPPFHYRVKLPCFHLRFSGQYETITLHICAIFRLRISF